MKVVLDSNVYVSAFAFDRAPERILNVCLAQNFRIYSSLYIVEEVVRVLHEKLELSERFATLAGKRIASLSNVVAIRGSYLRGPMPIDPKDGPIVKTCLASRADFLVTGDKELLRLSVRGSQVITATQFIRELKHQGVW